MAQHATATKKTGVRKLNKAQKDKVSKWLNRAYYMAFSKCNKRVMTAEQEDMRRRVAEDALIGAVLDYDATLGASFSTYLYRKIRWAILDQAKPRKSSVFNALTFTDVVAGE